MKEVLRTGSGAFPLFLFFRRNRKEDEMLNEVGGTESRENSSHPFFMPVWSFWLFLLARGEYPRKKETQNKQTNKTKESVDFFLNVFSVFWNVACFKAFYFIFCCDYDNFRFSSFFFFWFTVFCCMCVWSGFFHVYTHIYRSIYLSIYVREENTSSRKVPS